MKWFLRFLIAKIPKDFGDFYRQFIHVAKDLEIIIFLFHLTSCL